MRIISGVNKGKKLYLPDKKFTRPLKDLVKESIFNIISHSNKFLIEIKNSNVLDLFAGSGSFGLECMSRGSKNVYFFEKQSLVLEILKKNIKSLSGEKKTKIFQIDVIEFLFSKKRLDKIFDIIFLDPPFKEVKINQIIEHIVNDKMLSENGIIIIHRHKKDKIEITKKIQILEKRTYGDSKIYFASSNSF